MSGYRFWYIDPAGVTYALIDNVRSVLKDNGMRGFSMVAIDPASARRPYRNGQMITGAHYTPPREMDIAALVYHDTHAAMALYLRTLAHNASPHKDPDALGSLKVVTPDGLTRQIDCWMSEFPDPQWDGPIACTIVPAFWAPNPFFYDPTQATQVFGLANAGGVTYPADYVEPTGLAYVDSDLDSQIVINNDGDVETWPTIVINGPGEDPTIENETTAKTMVIAQHLDAGDTVTIDMDAATINFFDYSGGTTTNIIALMSVASVFYPLARGANTLHVTMTNVTTGSIVVSWYNYYASGL